MIAGIAERGPVAEAGSCATEDARVAQLQPETDGKPGEATTTSQLWPKR